ncbi:XAC2610-related protein [Pinibacter soli]|uniref:VCBS repeat-containing protein n=1 Tax=Pinibacter soli TaxID=3044211 RepID=A0ABT6REV7_9BACT|nr:hypothetical protein [Pinibacter soli]MDI3321001.1 hypothetical protein [Pinibacter soli]
MRPSIIIALLFLSACWTQQEQKGNRILPHTTKQINRETPKFVLTRANNCTQTKLSKQFDISIDFKQYTDSAEKLDSCSLKVFIKNKSTGLLIDSLSLTSFTYYFKTFSSCDSATSYTTHFKSNRRIVDNDFGDIVVADLNFDGDDDIAVVNDCLSSSGPTYSYFMQTNRQQFALDKFLTDSVSFFPSKINVKNKTLTTYILAGACGIGEHIYQFDKKTNTWKQKRHTLINVCKN